MLYTSELIAATGENVLASKLPRRAVLFFFFFFTGKQIFGMWLFFMTLNVCEQKTKSEGAGLFFFQGAISQIFGAFGLIEKKKKKGKASPPASIVCMLGGHHEEQPCQILFFQPSKTMAQK